MTMTRAFHRARIAGGTALLAVLVFLPFIRVNGESAFRFDVPTLRLFFFGSVIWMEDFFIVLIAVLALTFFTLFLTTAFGRIWCGWVCPQTVLVDLTLFLEPSGGNGYLRRSAAYGLAVVASAVIAVSLVGYFVSPYDIVPVIRAGGTAAVVVKICWTALFLLVFLDMVALRRTFCKTVCPYAKLQGVLFEDRTLIVAFDRRRQDECLRCAACVRACPVGIDIRNGSQGACIHCAECIDACSSRMAAVSRSSLVEYSFGEPGQRRGGPRISLYLTGALTAAAVLAFVHLSAQRVPFDAAIAPVFSGGSRVLADGSAVNRYTLSLRNTGAADLQVSLSVTSPSGSARVMPDTIRLLKGQDGMQVPIMITVSGMKVEGQRYLPLVLLLQQDRQAGRLRKPVSFLLPER